MSLHDGSCDVVAQQIAKTALHRSNVVNENDKSAIQLHAAQVLATLYVGDQIAELVKTMKKGV